MVIWYCWFLMAAVQFTSAQVFQPGLLNVPRNTGPYSLNTFANNQFQNIPMATKPLTNGLAYHSNLLNSNFANTNTLANIAENNLVNSITSTLMPNEIIGGNLLGNIGNLPNGIQSSRVTYSFGDTPLPVTVSGKSLNNQPIGLQIMADNLQVNGKVAVSGRMPLYGTVTINGNVPSDGKSSVNYGCGNRVAV